MRLLLVLPAILAVIAFLVSCGDGANQARRTALVGESPGAAATATAVAVDTATPPPHPVATPAVATPVETVSPPAGFQPAALGHVQSECTVEDGLITTFNWQPAGPQGRAQVVEVVPDFNRFQPGQYQASQPLPAGESALIWKGLIPAIVYYWRVSTQVGDGWVPGESDSFTTASCLPADRRG